MTQWLEWFVYPCMAACAVMGIVTALFWFLFIYDFPERMFRKWQDRKRNDDSTDSIDKGGYNPFD